jgi:hypothetical protein
LARKILNLLSSSISRVSILLLLSYSKTI